MYSGVWLRELNYEELRAILAGRGVCNAAMDVQPGTGRYSRLIRRNAADFPHARGQPLSRQPDFSPIVMLCLFLFSAIARPSGLFPSRSLYLFLSTWRCASPSLGVSGCVCVAVPAGGARSNY